MAGRAVGVGVTVDQWKKMSSSDPTTADMNTTALMSLDTTMARSASYPPRLWPNSPMRVASTRGSAFTVLMRLSRSYAYTGDRYPPSATPWLLPWPRKSGFSTM